MIHFSSQNQVFLLSSKSKFYTMFVFMILPTNATPSLFAMQSKENISRAEILTLLMN